MLNPEDSPRPAPSGSVPAAPGLTPGDRERTVELLSRHYAADRLGEAELQARLDRVYRAATAAQLEAALQGLPPEPDALVEAPRQLHALFSGQEQRLEGPLPRRLELRARFGYLELDLTHAYFQPGITEIDVRAFAGYVQVRLPPGVRVESSGRALFGFFSLKGRPGAAADPADPAVPLVRLGGRAICGFAECVRGRELPGPAPANPRLPPQEGS